MILISFTDRSKLLYMVVEENGQPWFSTSEIDAEGRTKERYTAQTLLEDWRPAFAMGVRPQ